MVLHFLRWFDGFQKCFGEVPPSIYFVVMAYTTQTRHHKVIGISTSESLRNLPRLYGVHRACVLDSTITRRLLGRIDRKPRHLEPVRRHFSKDGFCFGKVPSKNQVLRSILREYRPVGIDQDCWFEQLRGLPPEATVD